jgi:hypothetical protein
MNPLLPKIFLAKDQIAIMTICFIHRQFDLEHKINHCNKVCFLLHYIAHNIQPNIVITSVLADRRRMVVLSDQGFEAMDSHRPTVPKVVYRAEPAQTEAMKFQRSASSFPSHQVCSARNLEPVRIYPPPELIFANSDTPTLPSRCCHGIT